MAGRMAEEATRASRSVYPSGTARATRLVPMAPDAPGRFSTTILALVFGRWRGAWVARRRAAASAEPPGEKGATSVIGRLG
jgi:hypothetical protein